MKGSRFGFTLIELMVVIGILGIMLAAFTVLLSGGQDNRALQEGQKSFAQAVERVRTLVRRYSYDYFLTIAADKKSFVFTPKDVNGTVVANIPTVSGNLPSTVTIEGKKPTTLDLNKRLFIAPYARTQGGGAPICFELKTTLSTKKTAVDLVGVTGKVVSRAFTTATSACN